MNRGHHRAQSDAAETPAHSSLLPDLTRPTRNSSFAGDDESDGFQAEQDAHFFNDPSSPSRTLPTQHASRNRLFYRHRNISDTSVDSQPALIDHRGQPHSLALSSPGSDRHLHSASARGSRPSALRNEADLAASPDSNVRSQPSHSSRGGRPSPLEPSSQTPYEDITSADLAENTVASDISDTEAEPLSQRAPSDARKNLLNIDYPPPRTISRTPSPRPDTSDENNHHQDVCFPLLHMLDSERDVVQPSDDHHHILQDRPTSRPTSRASSRRRRHSLKCALPGMLPHFPFPFDFDALEEYANQHQQTEADHPETPHMPNRISFSTEAMKQSAAKRHPATRKLSESLPKLNLARQQRKVALFEGAGGASEPDRVDPILQRNNKDTILDVKTPLLSKDTKPSFGAFRRTSVHDKQSQGDSVYRFSFYSNALSNTIHARSLAELPEEGQSFKDLFTGHSVTPDSSDRTLDPITDKTLSSSPEQKAEKRTGISNMQKSSLMRSDQDTEANTWWLDILCPTDAEMKILARVFGIHPLTTEDIQVEESREKIELFRNYYLVCFRSFDQDVYSPTYLEPLNMYIIVFREGILSFHFKDTPHPANVRRRIKQLKDYINVTSDWISYALIDDITDAFAPLIQNIEYEVDSIDELVLILKETEQTDMLRRIGVCRKKVMGLLRLMGNKADVVKGLSKRCNENWSVAPKSDIGLYLSDIQDHLITMTQNLNHYEKILSRSHSNYLAQISIDLTDANNQINDVLSKLTAMGTLLIPLNLVTGLWGMNVKVPGQDVENLKWFFSILAFLVGFGVIGSYGAYRAFKR